MRALPKLLGVHGPLALYRAPSCADITFGDTPKTTPSETLTELRVWVIIKVMVRVRIMVKVRVGNLSKDLGP